MATRRKPMTQEAALERLDMLADNMDRCHIAIMENLYGLGERTADVTQENAALKKVLNAALDHQVANRGKRGAFYRCYTYGPDQWPEWVAEAEKLLKEDKSGNKN